MLASPSSLQNWLLNAIYRVILPCSYKELIRQRQIAWVVRRFAWFSSDAVIDAFKNFLRQYDRLNTPS